MARISVRVQRDILLTYAHASKFDECDAQDCFEACKSMSAGISTVFWDFSPVQVIGDEALPVLQKIATVLSDKKIQLILLARQQLMEQLQGLGMLGLFQCFVQAASLPVSPSDSQNAPESSSDLIAQMVEATEKSVAYIIATYANVVVTSIPPDSKNDALGVDVVGTIGFVMPSFKGSFSLAFPMSTFLRLMSAINKSDYDKLVPEIADWAGELVNVVLGLVATSFRDKGCEVNCGLPTVLFASDLKLTTVKGSFFAPLRFESQLGLFRAEISMERTLPED